jgi:hypothetical protein
LNIEAHEVHEGELGKTLVKAELLPREALAKSELASRIFQVFLRVLRKLRVSTLVDKQPDVASVLYSFAGWLRTNSPAKHSVSWRHAASSV